MISAETKAWVLSLKPEDITKELFDSKFSLRYDVETKKMIKPELSLQDEFILEKGEYPTVTQATKTNIGQYLVNQCLFGRTPRIQVVLGYIAKPFNKSVIEDYEDKMAKATLMEKITLDDWAIYFNAIQWLGNTINTNVSPSFTPNTAKVLPAVKKRREELVKANKEKLDAGDIATSVKIEKELLDLAKKELKDDVGMIVYDSKCKPKFDVAYKNMYATRGMVYMANKERFDFGKTAFADGLEKSDVPQYSNSVVNGAYAKALDSGVAGYVTKKMFATYQAVTLGPHGSDCHTKGYRKLVITKNNYGKLKNRYIIDGNNLVELTDDNVSKYMGKEVKMRSALYCLFPGDKLCSKCAGEMFYRQGIENVGMATSQIGNDFLNFLMKSFHDATTHVTDVDVNDMVV